MSREPELRKNVVLHFDDLLHYLGLEGDVRRVYVEPDNDYLHIQLDWRGSEPPPDGFKLVARGGYCDNTTMVRYEYKVAPS